jgi:hypothetical protein
MKYQESEAFQYFFKAQQKKRNLLFVEDWGRFLREGRAGMGRAPHAHEKVILMDRS